MNTAGEGEDEGYEGPRSIDEDVQQLLDIFNEKGLEEYSGAVEKEGITKDIFTSMTKDELKVVLKVERFGDLRKMELLIKDLKDSGENKNDIELTIDNSGVQHVQIQQVQPVQRQNVAHISRNDVQDSSPYGVFGCLMGGFFGLFGFLCYVPLTGTSTTERSRQYYLKGLFLGICCWALFIILQVLTF